MTDLFEQGTTMNKEIEKLREAGVVQTVGEALQDMGAAKRQVATLPQSGAEAANGLLSVIARAVADPEFPIDKMERLLSMQERVMTENARRSFNLAFRAAKSEIKPVIRNKSNDQTNSNYADLEAVAEAIDPIIDKHGFGMTFGTGKSELEGHYRVVCDLLHDDGFERHYEADIPADTAGIRGSANKTATHGFGSSMSYGRRYMKLMIWDVATKDDDGNAATSYEMINADQCVELRRLIGEGNASEEAFCDYIGVGTLPELAASNFERAKGVLIQRNRKATDANS